MPSFLNYRGNKMNKKSSLIKISIIMSLIFIFYVLSWAFLKTSDPVLYNYVINPLFWILITIFSSAFVFTNKNYVFKHKRSFLLVFFIAALAFIVTNFSLGIFISGFAKNPYDNSLIGILYNLWMAGSTLFLIEITRSSIINATPNKYKTIMKIMIVILFSLISINFFNFQTSLSDLAGIFKFLGTSLIPTVVLNILLTESASKAGPIPGIIYQLIVNLAIWAAPILPNHDWLIISLIHILIPFLTLLVVEYQIKKRDYFAARSELEIEEPKEWIGRFIVITLILIFFLGVTPIYPINIISNSMYPAIHIGDVVIVKKTTIDEIKEGDIIQYNREKYSIVHRVVEIFQENGKIRIRTKGDNNQKIDSTIITEKNFMGKIIMIIPKLGLPNYWVKSLMNQIDDSNSINN
jgi:signal peptidase